MIKRVISILFFALSTTSLVAQEGLKNKVNDSLYKITIDSIDVEIWIKGNVVFTKNRFKNSGSILDITFNLKTDSSSFITVIQKSPTLSDMHCTWTFSITGNKVSNPQYRTTIRTCLAYPKDMDIHSIFGYNKFINNEEFLKPYILKLYNHVKLQPTGGFALLGLTE